MGLKDKLRRMSPSDPTPPWEDAAADGLELSIGPCAPPAGAPPVKSHTTPRGKSQLSDTAEAWLTTINPAWAAVHAPTGLTTIGVGCTVKLTGNYNSFEVSVYAQKKVDDHFDDPDNEIGHLAAWVQGRAAVQLTELVGGIR